MNDFSGGFSDTSRRIVLDATRADVLIGGDGRGGDIIVKDSIGKARIRLDAGGEEPTGEDIVLALPPIVKAETILLAGATGAIDAGGNGQRGSVTVKGFDGTPMGVLASGAWGGEDLGGQLVLNGPDGQQRMAASAFSGHLALGGHGVGGEIRLYRSSAKLSESPVPTIELDGQHATVTLSASQDSALAGIAVKNALGKKIILLVPAKQAPAGEIAFDDSGRIVLANQAGGETIVLDGGVGDIVLNNADCAEYFDIASSSIGAEPGSVMVIDDHGRLGVSCRAYDRKVAGVVSGAGDSRPGIVLDRQTGRADRLPVALVGKVWCKVDAEGSEIDTGDLLTTSGTPGHAMKASDPTRAFGAILGKALRPLKEGRELIPVLVTLQ